ncbi:MAG: holo-ACP synthase [Candidatus Babeliales bacterium]
MRIQIGCDLVHVERFEKTVVRTGQVFLEKLFTPAELCQSVSLQSLAGYFAAKEATIKALELEHGVWHAIQVKKKESGRPYIILNQELMPQGVLSSDVSISHDGEYVMAITQWLLAC